MARRILKRSQRVPMVDADILEDRTRPPPEAPGPMRLRLRYLGLGSSSSGLLAFTEKKSGNSPLVPKGSR
jgi:hypothetical protein